MKMIPVIVIALVFIGWGCENQEKRYPVQGKWKIEQVNYERKELPDSVVKKDLGYLIFHECEQVKNENSGCEAERLYVDGKHENFTFTTRRGAYENGSDKFIHIGYDDKSPMIKKELLGEYRIEKLTDQELVIACTNCVVGMVTGYMRRFELRATKVPE